MNNFGWKCPAGAGSDPSAPFNQNNPPDWDYEGNLRAGDDIECPVCSNVAKWTVDMALPVFRGWVCHHCLWFTPAIKDDYEES